MLNNDDDDDMDVIQETTRSFHFTSPHIMMDKRVCTLLIHHILRYANSNIHILSHVTVMATLLLFVHPLAERRNKILITTHFI